MNRREEKQMETQVYADEFGAVIAQGATVRFDLLVQSPHEQDEAGKPKLVFQQRVIMPIDSFLRAAVRLQTVVQDLETKGVITRKEKNGSKAAPSDIDIR
jgi:hypothetical protein